MEADTSLVRTDNVVVLYTITHIGLHLPLIVYPSHAKLYHPVGYAKALYQVCLLEFGVLVVLILNGEKHLTHGLDILRLIGETPFKVFQNCYCFHNNLFALLGNKLSNCLQR